MRSDASRVRLLEPSAGTRGRERGVTLVEVVIVATLLPIILTAAVAMMRSGRSIAKQVNETSNIVEKLRGTLRRLTDELRVSSRVGEDRNENSVFDSGEDRNGNGRFDSDWAVGASSVRFNQFMPDGTYSMPITYRLVGENLTREAMVDPVGTTQSVVVASRVTSFVVLPLSGGNVSVSMMVYVEQDGGERVSETATVTIQQRN